MTYDTERVIDQDEVSPEAIAAEWKRQADAFWEAYTDTPIGHARLINVTVREQPDFVKQIWEDLEP